MSTSSGTRIAQDLIASLSRQISRTPDTPDPRKARHMLEAYGRVAKEMVRILQGRPGLEAVQSLLEQLVDTGKDASAQVPYICPECDEIHHDSTGLCRSCQQEQDWQDHNDRN